MRVVKREHRFERGIDDQLLPGESIWWRKTLEFGTEYGPTTVTAVTVVQEGKILGRAVVESLEPPIRYRQLPKHVIQHMGEMTVSKGEEIPIHD